MYIPGTNAFESMTITKSRNCMQKKSNDMRYDSSLYQKCKMTVETRRHHVEKFTVSRHRLDIYHGLNVRLGDIARGRRV